MKKLITASTVLALTLSLGTFSVSAAENLSASVFVTISDANGSLAMVQQQVAVTDIDSDGALTISDALYCAHEASYEGGAAAGFATSQTEYGLSLDMLWGTANGGSYGYYVNNSSAMSLSDAIAEGDYINAYVYTDLTAWSDVYCYFDQNTVSTEEDLEFSLTLSYCGYDANWNPVTLAVSGAAITVDGEATEFVTDENGKATITLATAGDYVLSAVSETQTLVPPVCKVSVAATQQDIVTDTELESESISESVSEQTSSSESESTSEEQSSVSESSSASQSESESVNTQPPADTGVYPPLAFGVLAAAVITCAVASAKKRG